MLTLEQIQKSFDGRLAVSVEHLSSPAGETLVLIGESGSGKSTLLRLMMGLIEPDSGTVHWGDEPVVMERAISMRRRMGYVVQEGGLFPHLTCGENATLMAKQLQWDERKIDDRLDELAGLTQLPTDVWDRYPAQVSGGQRQRVSLVRALFLDPEILFLDEPLGALDPLIRADLQADLRGIFRSLGKSVVLVTHDLAEARALGDRIALLRDGRIVQEGSFDDLVERPADPFVTRFVNAYRSAFESPSAS